MFETADLVQVPISGEDEYTQVNIDFGGIRLKPMTQYIVFGSVLPHGWDGMVNGQWRTTRDTVLPNDAFYYSNSVFDIDDLSSVTWNAITSPAEFTDSFFKLQFGPNGKSIIGSSLVPEPGTVGLLWALPLAYRRLRRTLRR